MYCKQCGKIIPEESNFCFSCGHTVNEVQNNFSFY
ncbi:MAG: zinc-ribbon domain-containing protein, partial [Clostridia bacterium]|nr:zinc-ribbon domain-containing protein [Clostridia bacterium]